MEVPKARGAAGRARERPTHGGAVVQPRLDRPALLAGGKGIGELGERGAGTNGRDEIVRLVFDDPAEARKIQRTVVARRRISDAEAGAASRDDDGLAAVVRRTNGLDDFALALGARHAARLQPVDRVTGNGNG